MLGGWWSVAVVSWFWAFCDIFEYVCCYYRRSGMVIIFYLGFLGFMLYYYNRCHGNTVKGVLLCTVLQRSTVILTSI
jgi:hypothetical protein